MKPFPDFHRHGSRRPKCRPGFVVSTFSILVGGIVHAASLTNAGPGPAFSALEDRLERLRARWNVPGMAAGIARGNQVIWIKSFGFADLATQTPVTPETVFHLASLTKPFAAVLLLQLVESGQLDLDTPVDAYGIQLKAEGVIRVRHLLTHTSEGTPGEVFRYSGSRFAELDKVLDGVTQKSFAELISQRILVPLALTNTSPNPLNPAACSAAGSDPDAFRVRTAVGYAFDGKTRVEDPKHFVSAAGLVSTVEDVLRFSIALEGDQLLQPATKQLAFTPAKSSKGKVLPYGLG